MIILLALPIVFGVKDCITVEPLSEKNIPCMLIAPFPYKNPCNTYIIKFYNETPAEIGQHTLDDYTGTDLCNASFNFTAKGTYFFNVSSGDSGRIIVEGEDDNMASFAIMSFFMLITLGIFWAALTRTFSDNELLDFITRRGLYIIGVLFISVDIAVMMNIASLVGLDIQGILRMILIFSQRGAYIMMILMFFDTFIKGIKLWSWKQTKERMGE